MNFVNFTSKCCASLIVAALATSALASDLSSQEMALIENSTLQEIKDAVQHGKIDQAKRKIGRLDSNGPNQRTIIELKKQLGVPLNIKVYDKPYEGSTPVFLRMGMTHPEKRTLIYFSSGTTKVGDLEKYLLANNPGKEILRIVKRDKILSSGDIMNQDSDGIFATVLWKK